MTGAARRTAMAVNLLLAEWGRLFARRLTAAMAVVIVGLLVLIAMGFAANSSKPTAAERARAQAAAASAQRVWEANRRECFEAQLRGTQYTNRYPPNCDYGPRPTTDQFLDYGFSFRQQWPELYYTAAIVLGLFGFVVGASFVGAEWTSGGMTNLLLWRPQRSAVLGAKLGVALAGVLAMSVAYLVAWTMAFLGVAVTSGVVGELALAEISSFLLACVRVVLVGVLGTAIGFALASIGRHTAVALGIGIAYLLVYELGTLIMFNLMGTDLPERLRLSTYVIAWLGKRYELGSHGYNCNELGCVSTARDIITWPEAGLVLGAVCTALVGVAFLSMRRRDIT